MRSTVYYIVYEKYLDITLWVCWCQNKLFYAMAVLAVIYVFTLLRFDLWKTAYVKFPSFWFYKRYYLLSLIHLGFIQHLLKQIWSTPICYVLTGATDLSWDTLISNQFWICDGLVLEILMDHKFWWPQKAFRVFQGGF